LGQEAGEREAAEAREAGKGGKGQFATIEEKSEKRACSGDNNSRCGEGKRKDEPIAGGK